MSEENKKKLLNKKREKGEKSESSNSESEEDSKPVKSIFGNKSEEGFKSTGLFGDLSNPSKEVKSLFGNNNSSNILSSDNKNSLFGNSNNSLFNYNNSSLFGNSSLFNFSDKNKKSESEEEKDDESDENNKIGKSNSPNHYNPEEENNEKENENGFKKIFVKKIDNLYLLDKKENKYFSKGNGYISIETCDKDNKKIAVIMFRNNFGGLIFEGFLNKKINKFNSYEKNYKHVGHFVFLRKIIKEDKSEDIEFTQCKIPFINKEDLEKFGEKYNEAIKFISED